MIKRRAQMRAIDRANRADAANIGRYFAITTLDFFAEDVSVQIHNSEWTRFEIQLAPVSQIQKEQLF